MCLEVCASVRACACLCVMLEPLDAPQSGGEVLVATRGPTSDL